MYTPFKLNKKAKHKIIIALDLSLNNTGVAIAVHTKTKQNVISFGSLPFGYNGELDNVDPSAFIYGKRDVFLTFKKMVGQFTRTFHDLSDFKVKEIELRIETPTRNYRNVALLQAYLAGALVNEFYNTLKIAYKWLNKINVVTVEAKQWQVQTLGFKVGESIKGKTKERSIAIAKESVREQDHKLLNGDNADAINIALTKNLDPIKEAENVTMKTFRGARYGK